MFLALVSSHLYILVGSCSFMYLHGPFTTSVILAVRVSGSSVFVLVRKQEMRVRYMEQSA